METKICTKCKIDQNIDNYYVRRTRNNQHKSICKECESKSKARKVIEIPDLEGELWKDLAGFEGIYLISNMGRLRRIMHRKNPTNKLINYRITDTGYCQFPLCVNGINSEVLVHRAVAIAFIPNPENKPHVNHKKGNKLDNRYFMLEWNTVSENTIHAFVNELRSPRKGVEHGQSKLTEKEVLEIRASKLKPVELASLYNISLMQICRILKRERWTHI